MQYYNKLVKKSFGRAKDDDRAVSLNQLVNLCCEKISAKYKKDVIFKDFGLPLFVKGDIEEVINKIIFEIEKHMDKEELHVCLERAKRREYANMSVLDENGNRLSETLFELYLGVPSTVISDKDKDEIDRKIEKALV